MDEDLSRHSIPESLCCAAILDHAFDVITIADAHGRFEYVNAAACKVFGYTPEELLQLSITDLLAPSELSRLNHILQDMQVKAVKFGKWISRHKNGSLFPSEVSVVRLEDGRVLGIGRDTTEQTRAQEQLCQNEERLRLTQQASGLATFEVNLEAGTRTCSAELLAILGLPSDNPQPTWDDVLRATHPDDRGLLLRQYEAMRRGERICYERRVIRSDGNLIWIEVSGQAEFDNAGRPTRFLGICRDVTDRKAALEEMRKSKERLEMAIEAAAIAEWELDLKTRVITPSLNYATILGFPGLPSAWSFETFIDHVIPEERTRVRERFEAGVRAGEGDVETRIRRPDGEIRWVWIHGKVVNRNGEERPGHIIGTVTDITERKTAEFELRRSKEILEAFVDYAPAAIAMFNREMRYLRSSRQWRFYCGLTDEPLAGKYHYDVFPNLPPNILESHRKGLAGEIVNGEGEWERPDGKNRLIRWEVHPWGNSGVETGGIIVVLQDVTEARATEIRLRDAHKMETVGELAGGVAHEFRNILCVIKLRLQQAMDDAAPGSNLAQHLEAIRCSANHGCAITENLLAFSRKQPFHPQAFKLSTFVNETTKIVRGLAGVSIHVEVRCQTDDAPVFFDPMQLEQVLINLVSNAVDAMPNEGTLTIETHFPDSEQAGILSGHTRNYAVLSITDTGGGIKADDLPHIFEPFFTTKAPGRGTGLGLSISHGLVQQGGGSIQVQSSEGKGTRVDVFLPVCPPAESLDADFTSLPSSSESAAWQLP